MNPLQAMLDIHIPNEEYSMIGIRYIDLLLKNSLNSPNTPTSRTEMGFGSNFKQVDIETEYYFNNFGYRDSDWNSKTEILAIGCSNTYGVGVPIEGRWTNILEKKINKKINNLSIAGGSINELVSKSFEYFKQFGNPETMLCLFPDPFRIQLPFKEKLIKGYWYGDNTDLFLQTVNFPYSQNNFEKIKYFKMPYSYEEILPLELPLFFSMQSIHMLEQYCKSNNIKLIWSSWYSDFVNVLQNIQEDIFNSFFLNEQITFNVPKFVEENCHKDYKDKFEKYFDHGADIENGLEYAHPGVHKHVHIAEAFYKEINK